MDIKKVIQLTNEQYEELLKNGQIEVNGEIKTKDDKTIYVCPASESWAELNNKIDESLIKPNKVLHNPYMDDISFQGQGMLDFSHQESCQDCHKLCVGTHRQ